LPLSLTPWLHDTTTPHPMDNPTGRRTVVVVVAIVVVVTVTVLVVLVESIFFVVGGLQLLLLLLCLGEGHHGLLELAEDLWLVH